MDNIIKFFTEGGLARIFEWLMATSLFISFITGMTKSQKDDVWSAKLADWITRLMSFVTHKDAPGTFKLPGQSAKGKQG